MNISDQDKEPWLSRHALTVLVGLLGVALAISGWAVWAYYSRFGGLPKGSDAAAGWGQLGDFFGGTLNPIFGLLSVLALFTTIVYQRSELKLSREELRLSREELGKSAAALAGQNKAIEQQRFEQTFFSWLSLYRELLQSISVREMRGLRFSADGDELPATVLEHTGRDALAYWFRSFEGKVRARARETADSEQLISAPRMADPPKIYLEYMLNSGMTRQVSDAAMVCWDGLYRANQHHLDSLFRTLYRLFLWIDDRPDSELSDGAKWQYASIVRAHLSSIEMQCLFYNGLSARGRRFARLVEKYALFDNLLMNDSPCMRALSESPPANGYYSVAAFSSDEAKPPLVLEPPSGTPNLPHSL